MTSDAKRILIIDDEADLCEIMKVKLVNQGFDVFFAHDGMSGFAKTLELKPDCILLDVRMPKSDGLSCLRNLRSYRNGDPELQQRIRRLPIIMLTAGETMKGLFQAEGVNAYAEKPIDAEKLKECILKVMAGSIPWACP